METLFVIIFIVLSILSGGVAGGILINHFCNKEYDDLNLKTCRWKYAYLKLNKNWIDTIELNKKTILSDICLMEFNHDAFNKLKTETLTDEQIDEICTKIDKVILDRRLVIKTLNDMICDNQKKIDTDIHELLEKYTLEELESKTSNE